MSAKPSVHPRRELLYPMLSVPGFDGHDPLLCDALDLAAIAHEGQTRWTPVGRTPYLLHPLQVFFQLRAWGVTDRPTLAAALLHDTVEDAPARVHKHTLAAPDRDFGPCVSGALANLAFTFGAEVADTVDGLTKREDVDYLARLADATHRPRVLLVKLGDFSGNALSLPRSHPRYDKLEAKYRPVRTLLAERLRSNTEAQSLLPEWRSVLTQLG